MILAFLRKYRTPLVALIFWLALLLSVRVYMQDNDLSFEDLANQLQTILQGSWFGGLLYILIYLIRPLILFPASLLTILGGSIFGIFPGFFYVLLAGTLSALIPYGVGRWFSSEDAESTSSTALKRFTKPLREHPFQSVLTMRLLYMPYDAVSLFAGSLGISFWQFFLATAIGNLAGTFSFVGLGASIEGNIASGDIRLNPSMLAFSAVVLALSFVLSWFLKRRQTHLV